MCCSDLGLQVQTAVGSRPFKREQDDLVDRSWQYDPTGAKQAGKPLSLDDGSTYDFALDDLPSEETSRIPPGHVVEYQSKVDILICTPGRLVDHIQNTPGFTLDHVRWLVIDEADTLLSQTFQGWIDIVTGTLERERSMDELRADEKILRKLDFRRPQRVVRKVVLSATMTRDVSKLSALKLRRPKFVALESSVRVSSAKEKEGEEREAAVGGDGDDDDAHETFELPSSLCEWAVPVGDGSDKPLYLIELLQKKILRDPAPNLSPPRSMAADGPHSTSSRHSSAEATSSDDSDSSSSSGSSSSERSRPPPTPATMEDGAHPAAAHKDGAAPANDDRHGVLIFTRSNESALRLTRLLTLLQPGYGSMMGTLTSTHASAQRRKTLQAFARTKQLSILIASDLVARGLDLPHLAHVINYDVPGSVRTYVHRVGRTARAHRPGQAWSLVTDREAAWFWNAIARGSRLRRQPGRRVVKQKLRLNLDLDRDRDRDRDREETSVGRKEAYEKALRVLAEEVRGAR
ncbi:MAG: ATP-dependent RNA helicase dbp6 [Phylliscum demangeonii]|nr:MAG: ATP-dependent RNA helicase dbp6 [Phylliscum demangeonii]